MTKYKCYIPITDTTEEGKILLRGYIRREVKDTTIYINPVEFDTYQQLERWIKKFDRTRLE